MKSLGILAIVMLVVPFVGTSTSPENAFNDELFQQSIAVYESHSGIDVDVNDIEVLASQEFELPLGATGVLASFNTITGVLEVEPISAIPDTNGQSACLLAGINFGYHQSPVGLNNCPFTGTHPGGVNSMTITCVNSIACYTVTSFNGFVQLYCQFNALTISTTNPAGTPPTTTGNGLCSVFAFLFQPANQWAQYYGYTGVSPPGAPTLGQTN